MKFLVTRRRIYFAEVEADSEKEALLRAKMGMLEDSWQDDDRPDEYSIECDPIAEEG